jgi:ABC-type sugar transport system ATPase subunit
MTMSDRVAVVRSGYLQQCDTLQTLYDAPAALRREQRLALGSRVMADRA